MFFPSITWIHFHWNFPINRVFLIVIVTLSLICNENNVDGVHLQGTWTMSGHDEDNFFIFLSKFGFQKTEQWNVNDTQGYIFGNLTSQNEQELLLSQISTSLLTADENSSAKVLKRVPRISIFDNINNTNTSAIPSNSKLPLINVNKNSNSSSSTVKQVLTPTSNISSISSTTTTLKPSSSLSSTSKTSTTTTTTIKPSTTTTTKKPPQLRFYPGTLVVLDRDYFIEFYRNRNIENKDEACEQMFKQISKVLNDTHCNPQGKEKFIRKFPCPKNEVCPDEFNPSNIVKDYQFTYAISDKTQAQFWYVSLVACYLDQMSCKWRHTSNFSKPIDYNLWLVNGNPYSKNENPLEYQFSFDRQDTVEIYLVFFVCYLVLVPLQIHAVLRQKHIVPRIFTGSICLELVAVLANVCHVLTFALDGEGYPKLSVFGDIMDILSRAIFMLILLLLAKGYAVTRTELTNKLFLFGIWLVYGVVHILLYVWNKTEVDIIEDIDEYQTWPGNFILIFRIIIMIWFIIELKDTFEHEHQPHKLQFFLHFGAASLVWFIYLPILALIALQISPLWRYKLILGITYSADCLGFAIMTHLLWPTRSQQYFLLQSSTLRDTLLTDELEEFDEAPHVTNPYSNRRSNNTWYAVDNFDVTSPEFVSLTNTTHSNGISASIMNGHSHNGSHNSFSSLQSLQEDNEPLIIT